MTIEAVNVRNQFRGRIREIVTGPVVSEVEVETPFGIVTSVVTTRSIRDLNLAVGTEGFASAMHQVATASEEQSDSIDEIAGAANSLSSAARRVAQLVGTFKLGDTPSRGMPVVQTG